METIDDSTRATPASMRESKTPTSTMLGELLLGLYLSTIHRERRAQHPSRRLYIRRRDALLHMADEDDLVDISCEHCPHEWETESTYVFVTCPSCMRKTPNPLHEDDSKDGDD